MERIRGMQKRMFRQMVFSASIFTLLPLTAMNVPADTQGRTLEQRPKHIQEVSEHWSLVRCKRLASSASTLN